jgi:5-methylcytosine-specific restriction protein B
VPDHSNKKVRSLSATDLGLQAYLTSSADSAAALDSLPDTDSVMAKIKDALSDGYAGVILEGPPGTSKSLYAHRAAITLADGDDKRVRFVQFHPSYQYEDFVQGYVPSKGGSFDLKPKHFMKLCEDAEKEGDKTFVLVIDELSRCDAARVFGEALTYIEVSKRGLRFQLSSGTEMSVPKNLVILATLNPLDRGVDDMDVALERRFAHVEMMPSVEKLREILVENGLAADRIESVVRFFEQVQKSPNPMCHLGHAYFLHAEDERSLLRLWDMQLKHFFSRACRNDPDEFKKLENIWNQLIVKPTPPAAAAAAPLEVNVGDSTQA